MPIYEYDCASCGEAFEKLVRSRGDEREARCPGCGSREIGRRLSVFSARGGGSRGSALPPACQGCDAADGGCPFQQGATP